MIWEWKTIVLAMVKSVPLQSWFPITKQTKADSTIRLTEAKGEPGQLKQPIKINGFKLILGACTLPLQQWQRKAGMTRMNGLRNTCCSTVMRLRISSTTENQNKLRMRHEKLNKYINLILFFARKACLSCLHVVAVLIVLTHFQFSTKMTVHEFYI